MSNNQAVSAKPANGSSKRSGRLSKRNTFARLTFLPVSRRGKVTLYQTFVRDAARSSNYRSIFYGSAFADSGTNCESSCWETGSLNSAPNSFIPTQRTIAEKLPIRYTSTSQTVPGFKETIAQAVAENPPRDMLTMLAGTLPFEKFTLQGRSQDHRSNLRPSISKIPE